MEQRDYESENFVFLKDCFSNLYESARKAELLFIDKEYKLSCHEARVFLEQIVNLIYSNDDFDVSDDSSLFHRIENLKDIGTIDPKILGLMHKVRILGNKSSHAANREITFNECLKNLNYIFILASSVCKKYELTLDPPLSFKDPSKYLDKGYKPDAEKRKNAIIKTLNACVDNFLKEEKDFYAKVNDFTFTEFCEQYELTSSQKELVDCLHSFFKSPDSNVFLLKGYAGTGKTYLTRIITEYLISLKQQVVLMAPTGKAALILEEKSCYPARTIHSCIYCYDETIEKALQSADSENKDVNNPDSWIYKSVFTLAENDCSADCVFVIDESSMISDVKEDGEFLHFGSGRLLYDLFQYININHNLHNKKIIFIGDPAQLPPVSKSQQGTSISPALDENYLQKTYKLSVSSYTLQDVVRQKKENFIYKNATLIRKGIDDNNYNNLIFEPNGTDTFSLTTSDFLPKYYEVTGGKISKDVMIVSLSNKVVSDLNNQIRYMLFNKSSTYLNDSCKQVLPIRENDVLLVRKNCSLNGTILRNGQLIDVVGVMGDDKKEYFEISVINNKTSQSKKVPLIFQDICFKTRDSSNSDILLVGKFLVTPIFKSESMYVNKDFDDNDINQALFIHFKMRHPRLNAKNKPQEFSTLLRTDEYFNAVRVTFGYAMTCHKAQGSEWDNVFVNFEDLNLNRNQYSFRWMYTAITRAGKCLYLINPPKYTVISKLKFR